MQARKTAAAFLLAIIMAVCARAEEATFGATLVKLDGARIEGVILEETEEKIVVESSGVRMPVKRSEVAEFLWKEKIDRVFQAKFATVDRKNAESVYRAAQWCAWHGLGGDAKFLLADVLKLNPEHEEARKASGYVKEGGHWVKVPDLGPVPEPEPGVAPPTGEEAARFLDALTQGIYERKKGSFDKALEKLREAESYYPTSVPTQKMLIMTLCEAKKYSECVEAFQKWKENHKKDQEVRNAHLVSLVGAKKWEEAGPALESALKDTPDDLQVLASQGSMLYETQKWKEGIDVYRKIIAELDKTNRFAVDMFLQLAKGYEKTEQSEKALETYQAALKCDPLHMETLYRAGIIVWNTGQKQKACDEYFEKYYKFGDNRFPHWKEVCEKLGRQPGEDTPQTPAPEEKEEKRDQ